MSWSPKEWWEAFKRWAKKLLLIQDDPHKIALGFAIGVFFGIFPTFGIGGLMSIGLAWLLRANTAAALLGTVAGFPLVMPMVIAASWWLGAKLLGQDWHQIKHELASRRWSDVEFWKGIREGLSVYLVGNTILSLVGAVVGYFIVHALVVDFQLRRAAHHPPAPPE